MLGRSFKEIDKKHPNIDQQKFETCLNILGKIKIRCPNGSSKCPESRELVSGLFLGNTLFDDFLEFRNPNFQHFSKNGSQVAPQRGLDGSSPAGK